MVSVRLFSQTSLDTTERGGLFVEYYKSGKPKFKIEYKNGRPSGMAISYHPNGAISEIGTFSKNKWVNSYKLYYENGQVQQDFNFDSAGKRVGLQKYYTRDGTLIALSYISSKNGITCDAKLDESGKLKKTNLYFAGRELCEGDKLYEKYKELQETLVDIANWENGQVKKE